MGKPNQCIPKAPLHLIPAIGKPFSELVIDVVWSPRVIQTDCGMNFKSKVFGGKCAELAIQHNTSVPYHPESQGLVERFHQTLKSVLKKHCYESGSKLDEALPFALFTIRSHPNSSTGVAPFQLVFGHKVRGPL
ncbi:igE-binding protein-like [Palaemon carinicauda]|uniref:igE-binding protein-like n=1 Tax=Palaemon carinicauda TaxID=392227 RepID=UPI0035B60866